MLGVWDRVCASLLSPAGALVLHEPGDETLAQ